jgi:hypothetical protein
MGDLMAYTYLIGWVQQNKYYYGVRFAKGCSPDELWNTYFTSSKHVKSFYEENGEPDVIQVRRVFDKVDQARRWETKVLKKMSVVERDDFLNKTDNHSISLESSTHRGKSNGMWRKRHTESTLVKMRGPKNEKHKEKMRGPRPHVNQTGHCNNASLGLLFITPWGKYESSTEASRNAPIAVGHSIISKWCHNSDKISKQKSKFPFIVKGKTFDECGFSLGVI